MTAGTLVYSLAPGIWPSHFLFPAPLISCWVIRSFEASASIGSVVVCGLVREGIRGVLRSVALLR